jgi:hypothetical protein
MAQTKAKPKAKSGSKAKSSSAKRNQPKSKSSKPKATKASSNGSAAKSSRVDAVKDVAGKAKVPLLAGGAALAGAAGGMALATTKQARKSGVAKAIARRPKVKVKSGDIAKAAKEVGNFSAQMGELTKELQRARESGNGKRRSPVEVVLQGLTARR